MCIYHVMSCTVLLILLLIIQCIIQMNIGKKRRRRLYCCHRVIIVAAAASNVILLCSGFVFFFSVFLILMKDVLFFKLLGGKPVLRAFCLCFVFCVACRIPSGGARPRCVSILSQARGTLSSPLWSSVAFRITFRSICVHSVLFYCISSFQWFSFFVFRFSLFPWIRSGYWRAHVMPVVSSTMFWIALPTCFTALLRTSISLSQFCDHRACTRYLSRLE